MSYSYEVVGRVGRVKRPEFIVLLNLPKKDRPSVGLCFYGGHLFAHLVLSVQEWRRFVQVLAWSRDRAARLAQMTTRRDLAAIAGVQLDEGGKLERRVIYGARLQEGRLRKVMYPSGSDAPFVFYKGGVYITVPRSLFLRMRTCCLKADRKVQQLLRA